MAPTVVHISSVISINDNCWESGIFVQQPVVLFQPSSVARNFDLHKRDWYVDRSCDHQIVFVRAWARLCRNVGMFATNVTSRTKLSVSFGEDSWTDCSRCDVCCESSLYTRSTWLSKRVTNTFKTMERATVCAETLALSQLTWRLEQSCGSCTGAGPSVPNRWRGRGRRFVSSNNEKWVLHKRRSVCVETLALTSLTWCLT